MFRFFRWFLFNVLAVLILLVLLVLLAVWHFFPDAYSWLWAAASGSFSDWFYDPRNTFTLTLRIGFGVLAFLVLWGIAANLIRTTFVLPARWLGLYDMGRFHDYLNFSPPWRSVYGLFQPFILWRRHHSFGRPPSSQPTGWLETMYHVHQPGDIPVGIFAPGNIGAFQPVSVKGEGMVALVAPPGSGKTVHIITLIQQEKGNVLVFDVDGQIIHAVGQSLAERGKKVVKLDPFNLAPSFPGAAINLIDELTACEKRHGREAVVGFAKVLADALIQKTDGVNEWVYTAARNFMKGLLLYVWLHEPEERRHIVRLRELLTRGLPEKKKKPEEDPFNVLLWEMLQKDDFDGVIARAAQGMIDHQPKGAAGGKNPPLSTLRDQTEWLDLPELAALSQHSDFHCEELKTGAVCLFIVAPLTDTQNQFSGWIRAMLEMTTYAFQRITDFRPVYPTLFIAEELPSLGRLEVLETAVPGFRKYGMKVVAVMQDLNKIKKSYPHTWEMFLEGECVVWLKCTGVTTLEYLAKKLGRISRTEKIKAGLFSRLGARLQQEERPVHEYAELEGFLAQNIIVTRANQRPFFLKPLRYYDELPVWTYQPDRFYGETPVRAFGRRIPARWKAFCEYVGEQSDQMPEAMLFHAVMFLAAYFGCGIALAGVPPQEPSGTAWVDTLGYLLGMTIRVIAGIVGLVAGVALLSTHFVRAYAMASAMVDGTSHRSSSNDRTFYSIHSFWVTLMFAIGLFINTCRAWRHQLQKTSAAFDKLVVGWIIGWLYLVLYCLFVTALFLVNFLVGPLLYGAFIVALGPCLYLFRIGKKAYEWLADQAIEGVARVTNYFPKQQRPVIRWLAQRFPARFQKAAAKARHAAASHHAVPARPDAEL